MIRIKNKKTDQVVEQETQAGIDSFLEGIVDPNNWEVVRMVTLKNTKTNEVKVEESEAIAFGESLTDEGRADRQEDRG